MPNDDLVRALEEIKCRWESIECTSTGDGILEVQRRQGPGPGRPSIVIQRDQIEFLRELRLSWSQIALLSRRTLFSL